MLSAEKVLNYELDGGGDGDILTGGVEADAGGMTALITTGSELSEPAILVTDTTV